jgi:ubiquinone/menaquinone biosynthesis C-methylase UbiE
VEEYYRKRAAEYEDIYHRDDPARQEEQGRIATALQGTLKGRQVLEIACGTGYWTQSLSESAKAVTATDIVPDVLEIAKGKKYGCPVSFRLEDAYNLSFPDASFDGGLANFWLSHVPKEKMDSFLEGFHRVLRKGSAVFMADNVCVPGLGGELVRKPGDENTYKRRRLKDGSESLVLKNYFSEEELVEVFSRHVAGFGRENVSVGGCFWYVRYEL